MKLFKRKEDYSYIREVKHYEGTWNQYDFLLAAQGYGWDYILDSAEYMIQADFHHVGTISVSPTIGDKVVEYIDQFNDAGNSIKKIDALHREASMLGVGAISNALKAPVKIVWINQTKVLRMMTPVDDEDLMQRYAETVIRRTFNTLKAMKKYESVDK